MPEPIQTPEEGTEPGNPNPAPQPEPVPQPPAPEVDYKEKFAASTRENQLKDERIKALEHEAAERNLTNEPTESEYRAAFPTWDSMSDTEKDLARRTLGAERAAKNATQLAEEQKLE